MKLSIKWIASFLFCLLVSFPGQLRSQEFVEIDSPFPIPPGLEDAVEFWKRIFTEFRNDQLVFFDPAEPTKIYQVLEVPEGRSTRRLIRAEKKKIAAVHGVDEDRIRSQRGIKDRFIDGLIRSGRYIEQMQQIFRDMYLPVELAYLPLVESSFNIHARSHAGAVGMWQFIRSTGRRFLRIDRHIDERKDPLDSTRAAALLLRENYELFGNWPLAVTAYNHGEQGLIRATLETGSRDLMEFIRNYESRTWGFASKNFYAEFLAAFEVAKNVERYFPGLEPEPAFALEEIELEKATTITALLKTTAIPRNQFLEWNPALSASIRIVPEGYRVKVPAKKLDPVMQAYNRLPDLTVVRHRVRHGETLSHIARRYDSSVEEIQALNDLRRVHMINTGQVLLIPTQ
jgi:membrane-bound lytic murein transglycosylase D